MSLGTSRASFGYFGYFPLFRKTASPSPVMFWTVKAPFWYALVAPRPEETAHPLRSRQPPRGCAGQARRDAPTRNECRAHPERPRPALRAGLAAPPTPLRTCAQCLLGRTLSSALLPPPLCCPVTIYPSISPCCQATYPLSTSLPLFTLIPPFPPVPFYSIIPSLFGLT